MSVDISTLEYGIEYDITTKSGMTYQGWYLYDRDCGYFTRVQGSQLDGFMYSESIESIKETN